MINISSLAKLARIYLQPGESEIIEKKAAEVLEYFNKISEVNTRGVEPFIHASPEMSLREDVPEQPLSIEQLTSNASDSFENCFRIPKVVGEIEQ